MRQFRTALKALLLFATAFCSVQAHAQSCRDAYNAIKIEAMDCGVFCNQDRMRPLQEAYEAKCIAIVIPASMMGFDSSPEPSVLPAVYAEAKLPQSTPVQSLPTRSERLLEIAQTIDTQQFSSRFQRLPAAEAFLAYCKSALARVQYGGPQVGLTEESGDRSEAGVEFARWRLATIFGDCTEAAYGIIDARDLSQESAAWIRMAQFLELDNTVHKFAINGKLMQSARSIAGKDDIFGTESWSSARSIMHKAMAAVLAEH